MEEPRSIVLRIEPKGEEVGPMSAWKMAMAGGVLNLAMIATAGAQAPTAPAIPAKPAGPPPTYTITLHTRNACVVPNSQHLARAEGGFIDVTTPSPNVLTATMTGTTAANSYIGATGLASEKFQLVQELDITCSDSSQNTVALTLDTALVGFVRSKGNADAGVRVAQVTLTPVGVPAEPITIAYPPLCTSGTNGQLCNQHLPPLEVPVMPVGKYTLAATLVLDSRASGFHNAHSVADFSPDTALPAEWVRTKDPFQGVSKKSFGFTMTVSAAPPNTDLTGAPIASRAIPQPAAMPAAPNVRLVDARARRNP